MTDEEFSLLETKSHERAFTLAGVRDLEVVSQVYAQIDRAIEDGTDLQTFKKSVKESLTSQWGKADSHRIETIFRTNVQTAYSRGRREQLRDPDVLALRPFWVYDATLDSRTSDICRELNGTVLPAGDPFWSSRTPPNHFNCRSQIRSLRPSEAKRRGISPRPTVEPQEGFREAITDDYQPSEADYPPALWKRFQEMQSRRK